jgi:dehydrogenase/reductase SDR family protein 12
VYLVTGCTSGLGFEIAANLVAKGARVYIVCRDPLRGEEAKIRICIAATTLGNLGNSLPEDQVRLLVGDVSLSASVRNVMAAFNEQEQSLDGLVCNAGGIVNTLSFTNEGLETTLATHLVCGAWLMVELAIPALRRAHESKRNPRVVLMSAGGMLCSGFPSWRSMVVENIEGKLPPFDGTMQYVYAKRGVVLLATRLAKVHPWLVSVSCHPGWVDTPGIRAMGDVVEKLRPLRSVKQGADGVVWLAISNSELIRSGEFYMDREPQRQHMAGPFFSDGDFTQNTDGDVDRLCFMCATLSSAERIIGFHLIGQ